MSAAFEDATAFSMLSAVGRDHSWREAIAFGQERITYQQFLEEVSNYALGFVALGLKKGDTLALWLPNRPAWLYCQYACARLGIVLVALNPRYRASELRYILAHCDAKALICTDHFGDVRFIEILEDVLPKLRNDSNSQLQHLIVDALEAPPGWRCLSDVVSKTTTRTSANQAIDGSGADDVFMILYTSGTTSASKGALITHRNCVPHGWNCGEHFHLTTDDRILHTLPLAGAWGGVNIPLMTFSHGACLVLVEQFDAEKTIRLIGAERITVWNCVDTMVEAVLNHPHFEQYHPTKLRIGNVGLNAGGKSSIFDAAVEKLGMSQAFNGYGMTEIGATALLHDLDEELELRKIPGNRPAPGLAVRVVNPETLKECSSGEEGELQFRGPRVTRGYYKAAGETARAFTDDGWFRSGDLGVRDAFGRVFFLGRIRDTLRINHMLVAPQEIEEFLMSLPDIDQAAVVGIPDGATGEAAVAFIVPKHGALIVENEICHSCRGKLASYKIPRYCHVVDTLPRVDGPHGAKVQKAELRRIALVMHATQSESGADRLAPPVASD